MSNEKNIFGFSISSSNISGINNIKIGDLVPNTIRGTIITATDKIITDKIESNDLEISGNLSLLGDTSMNGTLKVDEELYVFGKTFILNSLTIDEDLNILGNISIDNNTLFSGDVSLNSNLDVSGDINLNGTLFQNGSPFITSRWELSGNDIYRLNTKVGINTDNPTKELDISGDFIVNNGFIKGDLQISKTDKSVIFDLSNELINNVKTIAFLDTGNFDISFSESGFYDILIVGGGGSGAANPSTTDIIDGGRTNDYTGGGGGGAGGLILLENQFINEGVYSISVGVGGVNGSDGESSRFGDFIAIGGGAGTFNNSTGRNGGSGGGNNRNNPGGQGVDGQGNNGGTAPISSQDIGGGTLIVWGNGGGGGGAGSAGSSGVNSMGSGIFISTFETFGQNGWFASGGGGGNTSNFFSNPFQQQTLKPGGGGRGGYVTNDNIYISGGNGISNTGGGGGGHIRSINGSTAGNGGSGVVILRSRSNLDISKISVTNATIETFDTIDTTILTIKSSEDLSVKINGNLIVNGNLQMPFEPPGLIVRNNQGITISRSIDVSGENVSITNADGVEGNPTITIPNYWSLNQNDIYNNNNNNVGIGTSSPLVKLDVQGNIASQYQTDNITRTINSISTNMGGFGGTTVNPTLEFTLAHNYEAFDISNTSEFLGNGCVFDGRYIYFISVSANIVRYDTTQNFKNQDSYKSFNPKNVNNNATGFSCGVFDGQFIYFVDADGLILRYNTKLQFTLSSSYTFFNTSTFPQPSTARGFVGAIFDGRYIYFIPRSNSGVMNFFHGRISRYDTFMSFTDVNSYSNFDTTTINSKSKGFNGAIFDGRYIYMVPFENNDVGGQGSHGLIVRYDTTKPFLNTNNDSYQIFNSADVHPDTVGFSAGVFDGRYIYFVPYRLTTTIPSNGRILRYDTTRPFDSLTSYVSFESATINNNSRGFYGAVFDGRYIYFIPYILMGIGEHGQITRYDTTKPFGDSDSYSIFDTNSVFTNSVGFRGGIFDGQYLYLTPFRYNRIIRYNTGHTEKIKGIHHIATSKDFYIRLGLGGFGNVGIGTDNPTERLTVNGNVLADNVQVSSDDRIKFNEKYITESITTLLKLQPQIYNKISQIGDISENSIIESGLIAQEVYYDTPELRHLVIVPPDASNIDIKPITPENTPSEDPDYSNWGTTPASLNYIGLIPYLIQAVKEQQQQINELKTEITILKNNSS
jgi:hypothetical protein